MTADPCEVMSQLVAQEACAIEADLDLELLDDARSIAEAELQRTSLRDRFDAAIGTAVCIRLLDASVDGVVDEVGPDVVLLRVRSTFILIRMSEIVEVLGLPRALRREDPSRPSMSPTLSAILRRWASGGPVTVWLTDLRRVRGCIESVGADHLELRADDGALTCLFFAGIRADISPR